MILIKKENMDNSVLSSDDENNLVFEEIEKMQKDYVDLQNKFDGYKASSEEEVARLQGEIKARDKQILILQSGEQSMKVKGMISELRIKQSDLDEALTELRRLRTDSRWSKENSGQGINQEFKDSADPTLEKKQSYLTSSLDAKNIELMESSPRYSSLEEQKTKETLNSIDSLQKDNIRLQDQLTAKCDIIQELEAKNKTLEEQLELTKIESKHKINKKKTRRELSLCLMKLTCSKSSSWTLITTMWKNLLLIRLYLIKRAIWKN